MSVRYSRAGASSGSLRSAVSAASEVMSGLFSSEYTATSPEALSINASMISLRNTDTATIFDAPVMFVGSVRAMARQG